MRARFPGAAPPISEGLTPRGVMRDWRREWLDRDIKPTHAIEQGEPMPKGGGGGMDSYGATVLRIVLGVIYVMHAYLAAFVYGPHGMAAFQRAQGLPFPEIGTWYVILAHGVGGICLILGLLVRLAALVNIPIMAGALFAVHLKQGFFMSKDGGYEYALLVLGATIAQALLGAGAFTFRK
jgi:putative oxidoreductase